ncbi:MAG: ribonuclease P protein component [Polyangiaceae bacterium]
MSKPASPELEQGVSSEGAFDRSQRIRKRADFLAAQSHGRRIGTQLCTLLLLAREGNERARLGITASKKLGNAVARSRVKRVIREAFRATRELWASDMDLVVIPRQAAVMATTGTMVADWLAVADVITRKTEQARADAREGAQTKKGGR